MVLESIVSSFLNRFLGDYFDNFSSDNLTVGLWNGEATVGQLNMTPRIGTSCFFCAISQHKRLWSVTDRYSLYKITKLERSNQALLENL